MDFIIPLLTLIALEAILGIDNVIFISIVADKLPAEDRRKARTIGLILAGVLRLGLLAVISVIMKLDNELFHVLGQGVTGKDLILISGGIFLLYKSSKEIFHKTEGDEFGDVRGDGKKVSFNQIIAQILILDIVFSIDSIITAVGMVEDIRVMYIAVVVTVGIMLWASEPISKFVEKHPSFKMLALAFLLMIGFSLVAEGIGTAIPKGYIYFSMAFSLLVNVMQLTLNKKNTH